MEAKICVCLHDMQVSSGLPKALQSSGNTITFTCPPQLKEAGFPIAESTFNEERVVDSPRAGTLAQLALNDMASRFIKSRENLVVFAYGVRSTPKRQLMYGWRSEEGYATRVIADAVSSGQGIFCLSAYILGQTEHLTDLINDGNELGVIVDSVKEGPRVRMVERARVSTASEVEAVMAKVVDNYAKAFATVLPEQQPTALQEVLPPHNGDTIVLQLLRYEDDPAYTAYNEANSMNFIALPDCERPFLCGVDPVQQVVYEKAHRTLLSAAGIVASIKCSRLRIPFGKSKMSQMLRRCYNAEKGNPYNTVNGATNTIMLVHCFTDGKWAEESYHNLSMIRRICNSLGMAGIGSMLRDLPVEKWRLDQDIVELRDELIIAKNVYDYKPCIFEAPKPVANIKEEEMKRITAIQSRRDEAREKQLAAIRQRAKDEAAKMIQEQEANSGTTLAALEKALETKRRENASLQADRDQRAKEYEAALEKIRRRKDEEEAAAAALRDEVAQLEEELAIRQTAIQKKQKQLELAQLDKAKGREALLRERANVQAARRTVLEDRRRQREQWERQIKDINEKVLEQLRALAEERRQNGERASAKEESTEKAVMDDINAVEEYLPKLVSLEDTPANPDEMEGIRRQFDDVFAQEKEAYLAKIEAEKMRKEKLEKGLEAYRTRVIEAAQAKKKETLEDAVKKEEHLNSLVEQVLAYLRQGVRMTKVSSKGHIRRRFYFLSDDAKRIHSCELDNQGNPINRRKPPVTIWLRNIKRIVIGIYTSSFLNFSGEAELEKVRQDAVTDNGTYRHDPTQAITPANLGINNYRAFALLLRGGRSLEVVCDSDSDCEAWLVALKRLLNIKTAVEKLIDQRLGREETEEDKKAQNTCEMQYGGMLDIRNMRGFLSLAPEEAQLCSEKHIPPALFLRVKQEILERSQTVVLTMYDVRVTSGLDLIRSAFLYDYLVERRLLSLPV